MAVSAAARMSGINVSHFQQDIDWQQVRRAGITFAFIKATDGVTLCDPFFNANWNKAKTASILRGAYHFLRPQFDAEKQAHFFLERLKPGAGELPPVLGVEVLTSTTPDGVIASARKWLEVVKSELECLPILFTGSAFWRNTLRNSDKFAEFPLWIAHYTTAPNPLMPSAWRKWTFWQFSPAGRVAGITGNVDLDVFNGDAADLDAFCLGRAAAAAEISAAG
jgi:lysozyme